GHQLWEPAVQGERLADRALEVAVVGHRHGRLGIAQRAAVLRDAGQQRVDLRDGGVRVRARLDAALLAAAVDEDQRDDDDHCGQDGAADQPYALLLARTRSARL